MALRVEEMMLLIGKRRDSRIDKISSPLEAYSGNLKIKSLKGFTFIEILLVVVLLSIVAVLAAPNFSNTYYNFLLSDTSHNLTYLMRYAQARAIAERTIFRLNFDTENSKYWLTKETNPEEEQFKNVEGKLGRIFKISEQLKLECDLDAINFYPDGRIDKTNIYLNNKNEKFFTISTEAQSGYVQEFDYKK